MKPSRRSLGVLLAVVLGLCLAGMLAIWARPDTGGLLSRKAPVAAQVPATRAPPASPSTRPRDVVTTPATPKPSVAPTAPVDDPATLSVEVQWFAVDVVDAAGRAVQGASVRPIDCEGFAYDRAQRLYVGAPGSCVLQGIRQDGALFARSDPATIHLQSEAPPGYLQIELPETRAGGIGVRFMPAAGGMRVVTVVKGGPAWDAGLEVGDLIVSVNSEAVDGVGNEEFVSRMTGPEGSPVEFEVSYSDPEQPGAVVVEQVRVVRQFLKG